MTDRELQRLHVLTVVLEGQLPLKNAAVMLGVCYRQALRLKASLASHGPPGLLHGNLGLSPPNRIDSATRAKILKLADGKYSDFNDVHLMEMLAEKESIVIGRETLRRILRTGGHGPKRHRRPKRHHKRRERSPSKGMMLLWDGSSHRWFGSGQPACTLIAAIDDADNEVPYAFFIEEETTEAYLKLIQGVIRRRGIPMSIYMDRHSALKRNDPYWSLEEQLAGRRKPTQVGMAIQALGIHPIFALSPQAKGRIERLFDTLQDRLLAELGLENISSMDKGNEFLKKKFLARYNKRFRKKANSNKSCYRSAKGMDLKKILSFTYHSVVANDNTVSVGGHVIQIPRGKGGRGYAKAQVEVRQHLDGLWSVYYQETCIAKSKRTPLKEPLRYRKKSNNSKTRGAYKEKLIYPAQNSHNQCDIFPGQLM